LTPRASRGFALLLFTLGSLALAWPWLSGAVTIPWDAKAHFQAQIAFLAHALHTGESPFWNPFIFAGSPQIADPQSMIFSPPYLLLSLFNADPSFQSVDAVIFISLWIAGCSVLVFCLDKGLHPAAALVAAFAFANGGSAAWRVQHIGEVLSFCWFGLTLLLIARALDRNSKAYAFAAGLTAGIMVIGRDQIAYLCAIALAGYVLWHFLAQSNRWTRLYSQWPLIAIGAVTGLVLIALPLALTIALAAQSIRVDIGYEGAARGSLPPVSFLTLIVANLFGTDGPFADYWGPPNSSIWGSNLLALARNMTDVYSGALPFVALLSIGVVGGALWQRSIRFYTLAAVFMVLFALGDFTPFFQAAFHLPGINLFRRPADATFPIGGLIALLGAFCFDAALREHTKSTRTRLAIETGVLILIFLFCAFVAFDKGRLTQAMPALFLASALLLSAMFLLALVRFWPKMNPSALMLIVAGFMCLDLGLNNGPNESTALPASQYDILRSSSQNETLAILKRKLAETSAPNHRDRVELAAVGFEWPNASMVHGLDHWLGYNPIVQKDFAQATGAIDHVAIAEQRHFSPLFAHYRSTMANLLGIRWLALGVPAEQLDKGFIAGDLIPIARTQEAYIYENPRALPRVLLATESQQADFASMISTGQWPDVDYRTTVLLEAPAQSFTASAATGRVQLIHYANTRIEIDVETPQGGYVVLNDVWHPWWVASVDGIESEILRANVIFRAVKVEPGSHHVEFVFRPFRGLWANIRRLI
jgi:hypothetical protein